MANTIGNNPFVDYGNLDTCNGCTFALATPFADPGQQVTHWIFWADATGNSITPLLFTWNGTNFVISAIGTTRTPTTVGTQEYDFGLVAGTDIVGVATYFGYRDGTTSSGNQGTIAFANNSSGTPMWYFGDGLAGPNPDPFIGEVMVPGTFNGGLLPRTYAVQASTSLAPEPSTLLLMAGGLAALVYRKRRG